MRLLKMKDIKKQRSFPIIFLVILTFLALTIIIPMVTTPMRRPETMFRNYILRITPMGTNIEDVIHVIENTDDWGGAFVCYEFGFSPRDPGHFGPHGLEGIPELSRIGEMSVSSHMGVHHAWYRWFPLMEFSVTVFWAFDEDGKLIEVFISRIGMV